MHVPVQPAPVGLNRAQDVITPAGVLERLGEHDRAAVGAGYLETGFEKLYGVEAGAGCDIQHFLTVLLEGADEEIAFAVCAAIPIDQLVPFLDEGVDVLGLVLIRVTDGRGD